MGPWPRALVALFIVVAISGCVERGNGTDGTAGPGSRADGPGAADGPEQPRRGPDGYFPRVDDKADPVLLIHGFAPSIDPVRAHADPREWDHIRSVLMHEDWEGPILSYGYYGCDEGFDRNASAHGPHDGWDAGAHTAGDCGPMMHTLDTPIEHLGQHLAWAIHDEFGPDRVCVDAVGYSMGGLVLQTAIHAVDRGLEGWPPHLCVEDAVTMGTPHGGVVPWRGALCVHLLGWTQCRQMTDVTGFIAEVASTHPVPPRGARGADWTLMASLADPLVDLDSATRSGGQQRILFLDDQVGHSGPDGFIELPAAHEGYRVRVLQGTDLDGPVLDDAPSPTAWLVPALVDDHFRLEGGVYPPPPEAIRIEPDRTPVEMAPGQTVEFEAACANERGDLLYAEWWMTEGVTYVPLARDHVQVSASPWQKSRSITFGNTTTSIGFVCVTDAIEKDGVTWLVRVDPAFNDLPTARRADPAAPDVAVEGSQTFEGTCDDPYRDLERAQWHRFDGAWELLDEDTVQVRDHPWRTSVDVEFPEPGEFQVRLTCIDAAGATSAVAWDVTAG